MHIPLSTQPRLVVEAIHGASASGMEGEQLLTLEDARSYACLFAYTSPSWVRGITAPERAAGRNMAEYMRIVRFLRRLLDACPSQRSYLRWWLRDALPRGPDCR